MGMLTVVLLAALWASILLPGALRAHRESSLLESVETFERCMGMLAPNRPRPAAPGRHVLVLEHPRSVTGASNRARVLARRRRALARLGGTVPVAALAAVVLGGVWIWALVASVLAFGAYVAVLASIRAREDEIRRKVRRLPVAPEPVPDDGARVAVGAGARG